MAVYERPGVISYRWPARALHWLMVGLIVFQLLAGLIMVYEGPEGNIWGRIAGALQLYDLHKLLGLVLLALVLVRVLYRVIAGAPADEPTLEVWQREISHLVHAWLYFLMIVIPVLGWLGISLYPALVIFGSIPLPGLVAPDRPLSEVVLKAHAYAAFTLIGLLLVHVAAALYHHFVRRDDVLQRMLPRLRRRL